MVGKVLRNRYAILRILGSGGFGDTYLAEDRDLPGRPPCVVKQLRPKDTNPKVYEVAKGLFEREAEFLYRLGNAHPQIPDLFAHFEEEGDFYLVQEFIDGHDLSKELSPGQRLSETETIRLLREILEVLAFVHQNNVVHRDIKLQNLMRSRITGKLMLIDFGAVKEVSALATNAEGMTNVTVSIGSPGYMPSEQAKGKPRLSSDVYAVGMIGIQVLTGLSPDQLPEDCTTGEILWRDRAVVSEPFAEFLQTMVRYHFSQRFPSATEALIALNALSPELNIAPTIAMGGGNATEPTVTLTPPAMAPATLISAASVPANSLPRNAVANPRSADASKSMVWLPWAIAAGLVSLTVGAIAWYDGYSRQLSQQSKQTPLTSPTEIAVSPTPNADRPEPTPTIKPDPTSTPTSTPTMGSNTQFAQVEIAAYDQFQHSSGLFRLDVPMGWKLNDTTKPGEVIHIWLDPTSNALVGVDIFEAAEGTTDEKMVANLESFLRKTFGSNEGFYIESPVRQKDGSFLIVWGYTVRVEQARGRLLGNSFVERKGSKIAVLTTGVLSDQFPRLRQEYNRIINSFKVDAAVEIP
ncbi:MAG: protein kinase [Oscillatoriales cyanobacterium SM2_2_1]|nr:protein kinase [Oscillatoriales cyanobacterium SM2_2_1]